MPRILTPAQVWRLMAEGCNAAEISEWAGVARSVAVAMMANAARRYADRRMAA